MSAEATTLNEAPAAGIDAPKPPSRWKLLSSTLRDQRRNLIIGSVIGLLWMVGKISVPILVRFSIDKGIEQGDYLWLWVMLIAIAGVCVGTFTALRRFFAFREARWTEARLREQMFNHIMSLHVGYHDRAQTGQLMSRSSSDLQQVQSFVVMIPITISNMSMVVAASVILFISDWRLALVALAPLPFVNVAGRRFSQSIHPAVLQVQAEQAELATVVEESIGGVRVIKGFGAEEVQSKRLRKEAADIRGVSIQAARIRAKYLPAIDLLPQLGLLAVLGFGGLQVINGDLTVGQLVQFNFYVALLVSPLRMLGMTIAFAQRAGAALERVNEVLDTAPIVTDPPNPSRLPDVERAGGVRFHDVRFGYDADAPVLDGFDLDLTPGQSVALVGGTGSGKSTVARLLVRFYDVDAGSVSIDGVDVRDWRSTTLAGQWGSCSRTRCCSTTASRRTSPSPNPMPTRRPSSVPARLAGAHDFIMGLPGAYGTMLGERGYSLSGGQRQRIAIARAILADPRVLVLDDATSAVDPSKEHEIRSAMSTVMDGRTTIVIAHRPGTIALADTVVLLDEGRVVASGPHQQLLETNPRYREVLAAMTAEDDERRAELAREAGSDRRSTSTPAHRWGVTDVRGGSDLGGGQARRRGGEEGPAARRPHGAAVQEDDPRGAVFHGGLDVRCRDGAGDPRLGDRQRHHPRRQDRASQRGHLLPRAHGVCLRGGTPAVHPDQPGRRGVPPGAAHPRVRPHPEAIARVLRPEQVGRARRPHDRRHRVDGRTRAVGPAPVRRGDPARRSSR